MSERSDPFPMLILDAASRRVWVGLKRAPEELDFEAAVGDCSKLLFAFARALLQRAGLRLADLGSIAFNEGPGSALGIRSATMAIRAWSGIGQTPAARLFAYDSLALCAELARREPDAPSEFAVAIDARRDSWHYARSGARAGSGIEQVENGELEAETLPLYAPAEFPRWTSTHAALRPLDYRPETVFAREGGSSILRPADAAAPLPARASDFKKWTPRIHGSATA